MKLLPIILVVTTLALTACSSDYQGKECVGRVQSLSGQPLGQTQALVIDRYSSFTVTTAERSINSGPLQTTNRRLYLPSAVTREGYLAQRLSDNSFCLIDSPKNQMVTYICH
ncbi:hypothetical protein N5923_21635 [Erwiniaceae bacterium BAC15a-03b]|uniref:Lipoprotein n=1 Tax=Winslowiella arboricola TaxID=2978220 RepID=A0A9J6PP74_9GAMM|nr:hypothetical protein [Winslowiella arboricola]MCU5774751.1 hypothetical protein [Winslowiella arboricola]MCU5780097.1 hypothetical protein [Winslowiella arboricola]